MTENQQAQETFRVDVIGDMTIEWDVPIEVSDGAVLRADIFRPTAPGRYPAIASYGPYRKGLPFQDLMPPAWQQMISDHPDVLEGSSSKYQVYELPDPDKWVPDGYVCVRVDVRGTGRSPGYLHPFSEREDLDFYECIEWTAAQEWSDGKVGLNGISFMAMNQWRVAALQPPHLAAICVWEGAADLYRDAAYHGGILSGFTDRWYSLVVQYGAGERGGRNPNTGQLACGDEMLTDDELLARRFDIGQAFKDHPLFDDYYRSNLVDWSRIQVPVLSAGNWGGAGLHLRGNTRGYEQLPASADKWLTMHEDAHWSLFYANYGLELQKRFFGHFLKGEDTGWGAQPPVQLRVRRVDRSVAERDATAWPLPETEWTTLQLDAATGTMGTAPAKTSASVSYHGLEGRHGFAYVAPHQIEIAGPVSAKLYLESSTTDADVFLVLRAFAPDGTEIVYQGANDPHAPVAQGWLRASHRALDDDQSRPYLPVHRHDRAEPLTPGVVYELDVEIWPTSLILPEGYTLTLDVQGHDYVHPGTTTSPEMPFSGSGPFIHKDPSNRPADVYGGTVTLHTGDRNNSYLLLPLIPSG
jgi:predicted acyl esterase